MISLNDIPAGYQSANALDINFQNIEDYINNNLLDTDGTNAMKADINMNSYDVINVGSVSFDDDYIVGSYISIQPTAPTNPSYKHAWIDTDTNYLTYYLDGATYQIDVDLTIHDVSELNYNNATSGLSATNPQEAIDEHVTDTTNPHQVTAAQSGALAIDGSNSMTGAINADGNYVDNYAEATGTASSGAFDIANGHIQKYTLTANETLSFTMGDGQSLTLMIYDGDTYTVTWPAMVWVGGSEPTLNAGDVVEIWKFGSTLYGAYVGTII